MNSHSVLSTFLSAPAYGVLYHKYYAISELDKLRFLYCARLLKIKFLEQDYVATR